MNNNLEKLEIAITVKICFKYLGEMWNARTIYNYEIWSSLPWNNIKKN